MSDSTLEQKADRRRFGFVTLPKMAKLKKPKRVEIPPPPKPKEPRKIILEPHSSIGSFVKEQVIKLNPNAGERGVGEGSQPGRSVTIRPRTSQEKRKSRSAIVGGRRRSSESR